MKMHQVVIRGRITCAATKEPVAGADVRAGIRVGMNMLGMAMTASDTDGNYKATLDWDGPETAPIYIDARAVGYKMALWPWHFVKPEKRNETTGRVRSGEEVAADIELGAGFGVEVRVEDPAGRPLPEVASTVICTSAEAHYCYWPLFYHVFGPEGDRPETDAGGRLLWLGFPAETTPGEHYVIAMEHKEYPEYLIQRPENLPRENHVARLTIRLNQGVDLSGTVTDSAGKPIENAGVRARLTDNSGAVPRCHLVQKTRRSDSAGRYRIRGLDPGLYSICAMHEEWLETAIPEIKLPPVDLALNLPLSSGAMLTGSVLDAHGKPVADAEIRASWRKPQPGSKSTTTDEEGRFRLQGLPVRQGYAVHACAPGGQAAHGYAKMRGSRTGLVFDGSKQARLSGHLMEPSGAAPVPHIVKWVAWAEGGRVFMGAGTGKAADGAFAIAIPSGTTAITVEAAGRYYAMIAELPLQDETCADLRLAARAGATMMVRAIDAATNRPIANATVKLNLDTLWRRGDLQVTDDKGEATLRDHPPCNASLQVICPGYKSSPVKKLKLGTARERRIVCRLEKEASE